MDSELVVRQFNGEYRVKNEGLQPFYERTKELLRGVDDWRCVHVRREHNSEADRLANRALDLAEGPITEGRRRITQNNAYSASG
jgi:ribonuclease HI